PPPSLGLAEGLRKSVGAGLKFWPLLAVLSAFWVYMVLSNILYANNMQVSIASMAPGRYFATWDARLMQHVLLYPVMVLCVFTSLRIGWGPAWRAIPLQVVIGVLFSALATPALVLGEYIVGGSESWHSHDKTYSWHEFISGPSANLWLAGATSFLC